ncbi:MAG: GTP cyclohydrolase I FolE2 [Phycisphaeraceae bacterium]|nr:GTP cyclohydrolase I FolE2 [Phycisphaerales bacterium]MCB9842451.1 GTP cyclohydrolase I FolE2 [Phycisphaeraceae bacterium]
MTKQTAPAAIPDVQSFADSRHIAIDKVGVKNVSFPLTLRTREGGTQSTVASINMYVALPHHQKGTHMSRFLEVLNEYARPLSPDCIGVVAGAIRERLEAAQAHLEIRFPYFIEKKAPVTAMPGLMDYQVTFSVDTNSETDLCMAVKAPATSLCPCSKEISAYGAHNQRCEIEANIRMNDTVWIEDLAEMCERAASAPVYPVLKRPDEKFVTEQAFDHPKFVEDIVRDLAIILDADDRIDWYSINSENYESIHNHNAYAQITRDKREKTGR